MFTDREKQLILELLGQVSFKVGQSDLAREYEMLAMKLKLPETGEKENKPVEDLK